MALQDRDYMRDTGGRRWSEIMWPDAVTTIVIVNVVVFLLQMLGIGQALFALWLLSGYAERLAVAIATVGMGILIVLVAGNNPAMLTDPYGALIKDLCLIACAFTVWSLSPWRSTRCREPA